MAKTLAQHFEDLAINPKSCVLTHPDNHLLIYCREDRFISFEYRIRGFGEKRPMAANTLDMIDPQWNRVDR